MKIEKIRSLRVETARKIELGSKFSRKSFLFARHSHSQRFYADLDYYEQTFYIASVSRQKGWKSLRKIKTFNNPFNYFVQQFHHEIALSLRLLSEYNFDEHIKGGNGQPEEQSSERKVSC